MSQFNSSDNLAKRVSEGLMGTLRSSVTVDRLTLAHLSKSTAKGPQTAGTKKWRTVLINMNSQDESRLLQFIKNNPSIFEIESIKESHQQRNYFVRLNFFEKSLDEDLPDSRSLSDLIRLYLA